MAQVRLRCTTPNASLLISGIAFTAATDALGGVVSGPIEDTDAAYFKDIPGFIIEPPNGPVKKKLVPPATPVAPPAITPPAEGGEQQTLQVDGGDGAAIDQGNAADTGAPVAGAEGQ
jgi:hypothetical protein